MDPGLAIAAALFKRGSWWRQVDSGVTMYAAPTIPLLGDTVKQRDEHPWFKGEGQT